MSTRVAIAVAAAFFVAGGGTQGAPLSEVRDAGRAAQIVEVCRSVMGIAPIDVEYRPCVDSLTQSLATLDGMVPLKTTAEIAPRRADQNREREACEVLGFIPGDGAFAQCVAGLDLSIAQSHASHD